MTPERKLSRREFLRTSAVAGVGLFLGACVPSSIKSQGEPEVKTVGSTRPPILPTQTRKVTETPQPTVTPRPIEAVRPTGTVLSTSTDTATPTATLTPTEVQSSTPEKATSQPTVPPTPVPTKEAIPTKEEPKEMVTSGNVELYEKADKNSDTGAHLISGKEFEVVERQGDWLRIEVTGANGAKWQRWIQKGGAYYPKGEAPPTPSSPEPSRRFPKEIVLGNGQVVIHNMGTKWGVVVSDGGFKDGNGRYCPGAANGIEPCEGMKGYDTGMRAENIAYVNAMFAKYNTSGKILKIFFYDDINKFPYRNEGQVSQNFYRYGKETGNTIELHLGVYQTYDQRDNFQGTSISFQLHVIGIEAFLEGGYDVITKGSTSKGPFPKDLVNVSYPSKFDIVG